MTLKINENYGILDNITPREKTKQIENGENWIVEFWGIRGFDTVKTAMGISFSLHREPRYECLGLDLTYLEQFEKEAVEKYKVRVKEARDKMILLFSGLIKDDEVKDWIILYIENDFSEDLGME